MTGPKLTGCRCQCPACGDYFGSVVVFDRHRVGNFGRPGEIVNTRRCLAPAEMEARGWVRNQRGFWIRRTPQGGPAGLQALCVAQPVTHVPGARDEAP